MATSPEAVRAQLAVVTTAASTEILSAASLATFERQADAALTALSLVVPSYYDAAGSLAVAWYDELRAESAPSTSYTPTIIGDPVTDWIEREAARFEREATRAVAAIVEAPEVGRPLIDDDLERQMQALTDEIVRLAEKEVARGYRDTILGNTRTDEDAVGWSRVVREGACKFCVMLAGKGSVYRSESTAIFAAHKRCHCAARPEFSGGDYGPEADAVQYVASSRRARTQREQDARNARVRKYLNENYPDSPG